MGKVAAGFFSFTEVTDPSAHRAYNEWHQLDHLPEQRPLDGIVHGERWVASPACRAAWAPPSADLAAVHYLTLYLLADPLDLTLRRFADLARRLRAEGRFFDARRARLSGPFAVVAARAAPRVRVSAEAVPYRPNRGVHVVVERGASTDDGPAEAASLDRLVAVDGVAGAWRFAAVAAGGGPWDPGDHRVTVAWLDGPPLEVAAALDEVRPAGHAGGEVVLAGPFEAITPWRWDWFDR